MTPPAMPAMRVHALRGRRILRSPSWPKRFVVNRVWKRTGWFMRHLQGYLSKDCMLWPSRRARHRPVVTALSKPRFLMG